MDKKIIVNISRECGSEGYSIGQKLAKDLGINFYDRLAIEQEVKKKWYKSRTFQSC